MKNIFSKTITTTLLYLTISFLNVTLHSQLQQEWAQRYNGPLNLDDTANAMVCDSSGNIYIAGSITQQNSTTDFVTIKYNSAGTQQWLAIFNGPANSNDSPVAICVDNSGNVIVTGSSEHASGISDMCTVKYNSSGVQQWVSRFSNTNNDTHPSSMKVDNAGNVYVTGWSSLANGSIKTYTLKYSSSGVQQWVSSYQNPNDMDQATCLVVDGAGNPVIAGNGSLTQISYVFVVKYNSQTGDTMWSRIPNLPQTHSINAVNAMCIDNADNIYFSGARDFLLITNHYSYYTYKYAPDGTMLWLQSPITANFTLPISRASLAVDFFSGNVFLAGSDGSNGKLVKYNSAGTQEWVSTYTVQGGTFTPISVAIDNVDNAYLEGTRHFPGDSITNDYYTVRYNTSGIQQSGFSFGASPYFSNIPVQVLTDRFGSIIVTGKSGNISTGYDIVTVKYGVPTGIPNTNQKTIFEFYLHQNYPNPFNPVTKIKFDIPGESGSGGEVTHDVKLSIYDVTGREVVTLINGKMMPGSYEVEWNALDFPSGAYFSKLTFGNFSETRRMILVK